MGIVYLLTHDAMPGLTKIGRTEQSVEERMRSLNSTSVPFGFECFYAAEVSDAVDVERRLHSAFGDFNVGKEFFDIHPLRIQKVLEMVAIRDATPREEVPIDDEQENREQKIEQRKHLRRFSMFRIGLQPGDTITFARDETITAIVSTDTEVVYEGTVQSLSSAALAAIRKCGYDWKTIPGPIFWLFEGRPLKEIESSVVGTHQ